MKLEILLYIVAAGQLGIAALNLFLTRLFGWKDDLGRAPLLLREVFYVHAWFISITLVIFAVLTLRFGGDMAAGADDALRWLAAGIGIFWATRTALQVVYYSPSHWRGRLDRTLIHVVLLLVYGGFAGVYLTSALKP